MKKFPEFKKSKIVSINTNTSKTRITFSRLAMENLSPTPVENILKFVRVENILKAQELLPADQQAAAAWRKDIGAAMIAWGKLTEAELVATGGHAQNLARLVEDRYSITQGEAEALVRFFFNNLDRGTVKHIH